MRNLGVVFPHPGVYLMFACPHTQEHAAVYFEYLWLHLGCLSGDALATGFF